MTYYMYTPNNGVVEISEERYTAEVVNFAWFTTKHYQRDKFKNPFKGLLDVNDNHTGTWFDVVSPDGVIQRRIYDIKRAIEFGSMNEVETLRKEINNLNTQIEYLNKSLSDERQENSDLRNQITSMMCEEDEEDYAIDA